MSGVFGQKFGRYRLPEVAARQCGQVLHELPLGIAPGEVSIGLGEPCLAQAGHDLGPRECLGQEEHIGMLFPHLADKPFPEGEGFGVRIVHAKDAYALRDPAPHHSQELLPKPLPVVGLEVQREDVLVLLRRVLGELDRSVRPPAEPFRMVLHIGMVRRALECQVQGHVDAELLRLLDELLQSSERTEPGMHRVMTTLGDFRWPMDFPRRPARPLWHCSSPFVSSRRSDGWEGR